MKSKKYLFILECYPNPNNEDWLQKNYYILKQFTDRGKDISVIILDKEISINQNLNEKKIFLNEFSKSCKIQIFKISKNLNFFNKIFRLFSPFSRHHFKIDNEIVKRTSNFLKNNEPDILVSIGHSANCLVDRTKLNHCKKIFIIGGLPYQMAKSVLKDQIIEKPFLIFKSIILFFFLLKEMILIKILAKNCDCIISFDYIVGSYFNKKKYIYTNAVRDWLPKNLNLNFLDFKREKSILFLVSGNTSPNKNSTKNFIKYVFPHLKKKYENSSKLSEIRIVGAESELIDKIKNLKFKKINCVGWVKDISYEFSNNILLIVPNNNIMYQRTRIAHAFSCGMPVLTHYANTVYDKPLINKKNILVAKNFNEFNELIDDVLEDRIDINMISKNARKTFESNYKLDDVVKEVYKNISSYEN